MLHDIKKKSPKSDLQNFSDNITLHLDVDPFM